VTINNLKYIFKKLLYFLNYALVVYIFSKFTNADSAEIKKIRAKIKQLSVEKKRLESNLHTLKSKKELKSIEKEIERMVPKEKIALFSDLLSKL